MTQPAPVWTPQPPPPGWLPPPPATRDGRGVRQVAFVLIAVWAAGAAVGALPELLHDILSSPGADLTFAVGTGVLSVLSLNLLAPGLVCGVVGVALDPGRRGLRAVGLVVVNAGAVVATWVLSGWTLGDGEEDDGVPAHLAPRGLGILAVVAVALLVSQAALRVGPPLPQLARRVPGLVKRPTGLAAAGALITLVAGVAAWLSIAGRPSLKVTNDSPRAVEVTLCPLQECPTSSVRLEPGRSTTFRLQKGEPDTPDSVSVTADGESIGCLLVDREPDLPAHQRVQVSEADAQTC